MSIQNGLPSYENAQYNSGNLRDHHWRYTISIAGRFYYIYAYRADY